MKLSIALATAGIMAVSASPSLSAQALSKPATGPVIEGYGAVFEVDGLDVEVDAGRQYRAIFDVAVSPEARDQRNRSIETVARFLNMHARAGVRPENMRVALVLHGSAGKDALADAPYRARYGVDNPNRDLLDRLREAGVEIFLCGQTAQSRGLPKNELNPSVRLVLSAMTALVTYQAEGYALIAF